MQEYFKKKHIIYTVYKERSFSNAARKLFISQPALSSLVKQIEDSIGTPLFDRSCKPIGLTEAGKAYISTAEEIFRIEQDYYNYVCALNELKAGVLNVGSNQLFSSTVLPKYISRFLREYPEVKINIFDANTAELQSMLLSGDLDIVVDNGLMNLNLLNSTKLGAEMLLLAVPESAEVNKKFMDACLTSKDIRENRHYAAEQPLVPLREFADIPFILMTRDNDTRVRSDELFDMEGFVPNVLIEVDRLVTLFNFLKNEAAAAIVSDTLIKGEDAPNLRFYKLNEIFAKRDVNIFTKRNRFRSKSMQEFENLLVKNWLS